MEEKEALIKAELSKIFDELGIITTKSGEFESMDSLNFISLIVGIEQTFGIEIPDQYLNYDILNNVDGFLNVISFLLKEER